MMKLLNDKKKVNILLHESTFEKMNELFNQFFYVNSLSDNIVYYMQVDLVFVESSELFHKQWSHKFPLLSDKIGDMLLDFNVKPYRSALLKPKTDFTDLESTMQELLDEILKSNDMIVSAIKVAEENGDVNICKLLEQFLVDFTPYLKQAIIWHDKSVQYRNNYFDFDRDFKNFFVLKEEE